MDGETDGTEVGEIEAASEAPGEAPNEAGELGGDAGAEGVEDVVISSAPGGIAPGWGAERPELVAALDPEAKPFFLGGSSAEGGSASAETSSLSGDWTEVEANPAKPLRARQKEVARLAVLGKRNVDIAQITGYTTVRVGGLLRDPRVQAEIERLQERLFEKTVSDRLKELGPEAMDVLEESLRSDELKMRDKISVAQWVVEKVDGKAGQKVDVQSSTLESFFSVLKEMKASGEAVEALPAPARSPSGQITDAEIVETPAAAESGGDWEHWLKTNM